MRFYQATSEATSEKLGAIFERLRDNAVLQFVYRAVARGCTKPPAKKLGAILECKSEYGKFDSSSGDSGGGTVAASGWAAVRPAEYGGS